MLIALKQRLVPTDEARELELAKQYKALKKPPRAQNLDNWLQQWEKTYSQCVELKLPEVDKDRPLYDFLNTISSVSPEFTGYWIHDLQAKRKSGQKSVTFFELIEYFRESHRLSMAQKGRASSGAFTATFQGQPADDTTEEKKLSPCLCGIEHRYKDCPYLNELVRPKDWKPDLNLQKQIDEKLQKSLRLRTSVERMQKRQGKSMDNPTQSSTPASFTVSIHTISAISDYQLRDSFILDSGADTHICNNRQHFQTFRPAGSEEYLYAGNTIISIEGFGSVSITVQTPKGSQEITLLETAFVPSFHTNIASLNRFIEKDVHWDMKEKKLVYKNLTVCSVEYHHRQWTLEYNEPDHHAFPAYSAQPKTTHEITADIWH